MRISVDPDDSGYSASVIDATVVLDGEILHDCITADEEAGAVLIYARDQDGKFIAKDGKVVTKMRHGRVSIRFT